MPVSAGRILVTQRPAWAFNAQTAGEALAKQFGTLSLEGFGLDDDLRAWRSARRVRCSNIW